MMDFHHPIWILLSEVRCSRQNQAIAGGAGDVTIRSYSGSCNVEFACERTAKLRIERLLNLRVIGVFWKGKYLEDGEFGVENVD